MVVLAGFPVLLWRTWQQQTDALMREFMLRGFDHDQAYDLDEIHRAAEAFHSIGDAVDAQTRGRTHLERVDLVLEHDAADVDAFDFLQGVANEAVMLARTGRLLTAPSLPEIIALRDWVCHSIVTQARGAEPVPYDQREALSQPVDTDAFPLAQWEGLKDLSLQQAWIVGDDLNRIVGVSDPALDMLGWSGADLVGQRLLVVIPQRYRDRHLAGLSRNVESGRQVLPEEVPLPIWACHRDGTDVPVWLRLSRHTGNGGRVVFVARLTARDDRTLDVHRQEDGDTPDGDTPDSTAYGVPVEGPPADEAPLQQFPPRPGTTGA